MTAVTTFGVSEPRARCSGYRLFVDLFVAALIGAAGALVHDAIELGEVLRSRRNDIPEEWRSIAFLTAELLRILAGSGIAAALAFGDQVGPLGAFFVGLLGPALLQRAMSVLNRPRRNV